MRTYPNAHPESFLLLNVINQELPTHTMLQDTTCLLYEDVMPTSQHQLLGTARSQVPENLVFMDFLK